MLTFVFYSRIRGLGITSARLLFDRQLCVIRQANKNIKPEMPQKDLDWGFKPQK